MSTHIPGSIYPYPPHPNQPSGAGSFHPSHHYAPSGPFSGHATLANNLVSYWKMDEESGSRLDSITATANDLTDNNTVTSVAGMRGNAAFFTAANVEKLTRTNPTGMDWTGATTLALWVKYDNANAFYDTFNVSGNPVRVVRESGAGATFIDCRAFAISLALGNIASGAWAHIVTWHDGAGNYGASLNNGTPVTASGAQNIAGTNLFFGTFSDGAANPLQGAIDETGFWSRKITDQERSSLYNSGAGLFY